MERIQKIQNPQTDWGKWVNYLANAINALIEENEGLRQQMTELEGQNKELRADLGATRKKLEEVLAHIYQRPTSASQPQSPRPQPVPTDPVPTLGAPVVPTWGGATSLPRWPRLFVRILCETAGLSLCFGLIYFYPTKLLTNASEYAILQP